MGIDRNTDPFGTGKLPIGVILNGRYMILRKIAQGGMGAVYEAKEVPTSPNSRRLAIKEMSFTMLNRLQPNQRDVVVNSFHREYDLLSRLNHPNLVRAFEFFEENGRQYFVMEYIEGNTLENLLDNLPPKQFFPMDQFLAWARQMCDALRYLHSQNPPIIYRDLKPSNVMEVGGSNLLKLFDFGIARFYKPGQRSDTVRFGTDGYLAPEIIAYQTQTSEKTDIFALGAVLHQLLTRYDPQVDPWRRPAIHSINPSVPDYVYKAVERALALNPDKRSPNAEALLKDLFGEQAEIEATNPSMVNPFKAEGVGVEQRANHIPVPAYPSPKQEMPAVAQQPKLAFPSQPSKLTINLHLGSAEQGQVATGYVQVAVPKGGFGQVTSTAPWLAASPENFSTADSRITIRAQTSRLPLSIWGDPSEPEWFRRIPAPFHGWLGLHLRYLMPTPRLHQGALNVVISGVSQTDVEVTIQVRPSSPVVLFGWLMVVGLMSVEIFFLLGVLLIILLLIL
jgi:serine/threonine protein kinase